jgi:hypothetical protein
MAVRRYRRQAGPPARHWLHPQSTANPPDLRARQPDAPAPDDLLCHRVDLDTGGFLVGSDMHDPQEPSMVEAAAEGPGGSMYLRIPEEPATGPHQRKTAPGQTADERGQIQEEASLVRPTTPR